MSGSRRKKWKRIYRSEDPAVWATYAAYAAVMVVLPVALVIAWFV